MKIRTGKDKAWYCINRVQVGKKSPSYLVTVKRQGINVTKHFSVSVLGGEEEAFKAAQEWRDRVLALLPPMTYRQLKTLVRANNNSGIPGVWRTNHPTCPYWMACIETGAQKRTRKFSVKKYGEENAKQMAIEARRQMLQTGQDKFWVATEASLDLTVQTFADPKELAANDALAWDDSVQEHFLERLRAEGLIGKPPTPQVRMRSCASLPGSIWEACYVTIEGTRIRRRFSVAKYGDKEAECLAWQAYDRLKEEFSSPQSSVSSIGLSDKLNEYPAQLLDAVIRKLSLKNDAALARTLGVAPPLISKIRRRRMPVGAAILVRMLETTQLHIRDLYRLAVASMPSGITTSTAAQPVTDCSRKRERSVKAA